VKLTYTNSRAYPGEVMLNNTYIWYGKKGRGLTVEGHQIFNVNDIWASTLRSAGCDPDFVELSNPTLLNYVCYLIETGQLEV
jgi:hypothetical protein